MISVFLRSATLVVAVLSALMMLASPSRSADKAEAAQGPPLNVAVLVSSRLDACYDRGDVGAIKRLATAEQDRINRLGGIHGRPIALRFFDDRRDEQQVIANLATALAEPQLLAMIGLSSSNRAEAAFKVHGKAIGDSGVVFLSDISVNRVFAPYPNVFTTRSSQEDERVPVTVAFLQAMGFARPAFTGLADSVFSGALGDGLKSALGANAIVADHRLKLVDRELPAAAVTAAIADLKSKDPDVLVLSIGSSRTGDMMKAMRDAGVTPALFMTGRIENIPPDIANSWPNAIYQLAWDRLPELDNDRLRKQIGKGAPGSWVFEGAKQPNAPGWATNECKPRAESLVPDPLTPDNQRAIEIGTQFADMVGLVAQAARAAPRTAEIAAMRSTAVAQIKTAFAAGRGAFKGPYGNWSFDPKTRAATRTPFVVILPGGLGRTQLAPVQFVRLRDGSLKQIDTLYTDIDLVKLYNVDDNEKSFNAEFFLSIRDNPNASIERINFANAYLDPRTNSRQITIEALHDGKPNPAYPQAMKIYKVTGRFIFEPDLQNYPFDNQRFAIELTPKRGDQPFIVQPPPATLRDATQTSDGWDPKIQYVGYDGDFVPVIDAYTHTPSIVPFYKSTFVWLMKRQTTDYYLRVVVPLGFILIVAYLSIFIPLSHFEAIVTIQVTALLSAVALYLSLPKLDSDAATVSDRIFVFVYMLVSLMITISIAMVNRRVAGRPWFKGALMTVHILLMPALALLMALYVYGISLIER